MKKISVEEFERKFVSVDGDVYDLGMIETDNKMELLKKEIYTVGSNEEYMKLEVRLYETFENDGYQAVRFQDVTIDGFFTDSLDQLINESDSVIMNRLNIYDVYQYSDFNYENWKTLYTCSYTIDSQDDETEEYKSGDTFMFEEETALDLFKKRINTYDLENETPFVWCETFEYDFEEEEYIIEEGGRSVFTIEIFSYDDEEDRQKDEEFIFIKDESNRFVCEI